MSTRPRRRFGQHFLHDPAIIERIVDWIAPRPGQSLLEIGPGPGALTGRVLARAGRLAVIEIDRDLAAALRERWPGPSGLSVHEGDALRFRLEALGAPLPLRVFGNLPYNVSTPLLFHLLAQHRQITDLHFMLQDEVVRRLAAAPGGKDYGRLSVMAQYGCRVEAGFSVAPGAFVPPPKVLSRMVRLVPYTTPPVAAEDPAQFERVVRLLFSQRRKQIGRALRGILDAAQIRHAGLDPQTRPERLTVAEFVALSDAAGPAR